MAYDLWFNIQESKYWFVKYGLAWFLNHGIILYPTKMFFKNNPDLVYQLDPWKQNRLRMDISNWSP